jgi:uncharacterized protein YceK
MNVKLTTNPRWKLLILLILASSLIAGCATLTMEVETSEGQPGVRTQMEATDPESVSLNAGQPQLVKFFAFW